MLYSTSRPTTMISNTLAYAPTPSSTSSSPSSTTTSRNNSVTSISSSDSRAIMSFTPSISEPLDLYSISSPHVRSDSCTSASRCAYPSWPTGAALVRNASQQSHASSYISDEDLFGDDDETYLSEPPPPPRSAEVWLAKPLLPPVVEFKPRRSSVHFSKTATKKRTGSGLRRKE